MANELDELLAMFGSDADKAAFNQILERNPSARERATSMGSLWQAIAVGDEKSIAEQEAKFKKQEPPPPAPTNNGSVSNAALEALLAKVNSLSEQIQRSSQSTMTAEKIEEIALAKAKQIAAEEGNKLYERSLRGADELYTVRTSHAKEFGTELDTTKFSEFLNANAGKFASLAAAHDAMVSEDRIQNRIKKGIDEFKQQQSSTAVPGQTLNSSEQYRTPLPKMLEFNDKMTTPKGAEGNGQARGAAIDAAVRDWRAIRAARGES